MLLAARPDLPATQARTAPDATAGSRGESKGVPSGRARLVVLVAALAVALAAALIVLSVTGSSGGKTARPAGSPVAGAAQTQVLLRGIPQRGTALGNPAAPATLVEFADLQCPWCGVWARDTLPVLVREYVRSGKLRVVFRGLAFVGADSEPALRTALAAAGQNRLWNVVDLIFRNQGQENTGWVTESLLQSVGTATPGLDVEQMLSDRGSADVDREVEVARRAAQAAGVPGTPYFQLGRTGGTLRHLDLKELDAAPFRAAIERLLVS